MSPAPWGGGELTAALVWRNLCYEKQNERKQKLKTGVLSGSPIAIFLSFFLKKPLTLEPFHSLPFQTLSSSINTGVLPQNISSAFRIRFPYVAQLFFVAQESCFKTHRDTWPRQSVPNSEAFVKLHVCVFILNYVMYRMFTFLCSAFQEIILNSSTVMKKTIDFSCIMQNIYILKLCQVYRNGHCRVFQIHFLASCLGLITYPF